MHRLSEAQLRLQKRDLPDAHIDDLIHITTLDLAKGYWQVQVREMDCPKMAFTTHQGLYQFRVMPFGLQGAPATFQRMMDSLLRELRKFTTAYLDDIVVFSTSWEEHLLHLRSVLQQLQEEKLTIKPKKCQFGMNSLPTQAMFLETEEYAPRQSTYGPLMHFHNPRQKSKYLRS